MTCLNCLYFPMCMNIAVGEKTITSEVCEVFTSSADMVEVVRCKECCFYREAHYEDEGKGEPPYIKHVCTIFKCQIQLDGYCSLAERKDGEQNA